MLYFDKYALSLYIASHNLSASLKPGTTIVSAHIIITYSAEIAHLEEETIFISSRYE